jgi:TM2 domain-containing membrane protein YozV
MGSKVLSAEKRLPQQVWLKEGKRSQYENKSSLSENCQSFVKFPGFPKFSSMTRKSVCVTYLLWLIGGWFGLHQIYLRRDRHAFLIWSSAAGYLGFGLLRDLWRIPEYVKDANEDPGYMEELIKNMKKKRKVSF